MPPTDLQRWPLTHYYTNVKRWFESRASHGGLTFLLRFWGCLAQLPKANDGHGFCLLGRHLGHSNSPHSFPSEAKASGREGTQGL